MKHIYLINNGSRAAQYGIGTYIEQVLISFRNMKSTQLTVIDIDSEEEEINEKDNEGVRHLKLPKIYGWGREKDVQRFYRGISFLLALYVNPIDENVFHFNYSYHVTLIDFLKERYPTCKTVLTIHYFNWCFTLKGNLKQLKTILSKDEKERTAKEMSIYKEHQQELISFGKVDKIICLAEYTKLLLLQVYKVDITKVALAYNGLQDIALFLSDDEKKKKKTDLLLPTDEKILLFVGRLDTIKGLDYLIKAFIEVVKIMPNTHLWVVGDGDYNKYLHESNGFWNKISFTGKVSKQKLYEFYQIADVGVMPSFHEQCSYVAIEMMMHGLPLIITNTTGLGEMLDSPDDECKLLLEEKENSVELSVKNLSRSILNIITNPTWANEVGRRNRHRYETTFSLTEMQLKLENLY